MLGKHSGRNALRSRLVDLGITLSDEELGRCYRLIMALADVKKDINDADLLRLARDAERGQDVSNATVVTSAAPGNAA